jgi:hypothetical protein
MHSSLGFKYIIRPNTDPKLARILGASRVIYYIARGAPEALLKFNGKISVLFCRCPELCGGGVFAGLSEKETSGVLSGLAR